MESLIIDSASNSLHESNHEEAENIAPANCQPKSIATPVIKSLASVLKAQTALQDPKINYLITPLRECPQEPVFSPYYYQKH